MSLKILYRDGNDELINILLKVYGNVR